MLKGNKEQEQEEKIQRLQIFEKRNITYADMFDIYSKNAMEPQFRLTMYSALIMIFMPALTNLYFTFRPYNIFAKVGPVAMPILCVCQYIGVWKYEMERFCFGQDEKSVEVRKLYKELLKNEEKNYRLVRLENDIKHYEKSQTEKAEKQLKIKPETPKP